MLMNFCFIRLGEGTENFKNKQNLLKEKFLTYNSLASQQSDSTSASSKKESPYITEMKKLDLFDLGVVLIISATGGLDVISEEALSLGLPLLSSSCCLLHAVQKVSSPSKGLLVIKRILSRLSP